jgi:hypothetical protein
LLNFPKTVIVKMRGNEMAAKVKPVQPTEIKDKKMVREIIEQIRKPIPASVYRRNRRIAELVGKMTRSPQSKPEEAEVSLRK